MYIYLYYIYPLNGACGVNTKINKMVITVAKLRRAPYPIFTLPAPPESFLEGEQQGGTLKSTKQNKTKVENAF